jgi:hypothetical protein
MQMSENNKPRTGILNLGGLGIWAGVYNWYKRLNSFKFPSFWGAL